MSQSNLPLSERIRAELLDSLDEELEQEFDDERLASLFDEEIAHADSDALTRSVYFKELFRLQRELVKLQNWIAHTKQKVVVNVFASGSLAVDVVSTV